MGKKAGGRREEKKEVERVKKSNERWRTSIKEKREREK